MTHTDIKTQGWISRLPNSWQPYAILMRLDRPIGWWLLLLPGWWGMMLGANGLQGMYGIDYYRMTLFFFGAILMRGAGCIVNDMWDRDLDGQVERTRMRPLASGQINMLQASALLFMLLFTGFVILVQTSGTAIWLGILSLFLIGSYPYMKRITWWPQAFLGLTFNFSALMGFATATNRVDAESFLLYVSCFFWTLGYDTIYAHQDKKDDEMIGIKSTALLFGQRSPFWVSLFYGLSFMLLVATLLYAGAGYVSLALLILPALYGLKILREWDMDDPQNSLDMFKANKNYGLLILIAISAHSFWEKVLEPFISPHINF
jgi:4-hydroxybenzoate polyprenyltransferase